MNITTVFHLDSIAGDDNVTGDAVYYEAIPYTDDGRPLELHGFGATVSEAVIDLRRALRDTE